MISNIIMLLSIPDFILKLLKSADNFAVVVIKLQYVWVAIILSLVFELNTHKNLIIDTSQAIAKLHIKILNVFSHYQLPFDI